MGLALFHPARDKGQVMEEIQDAFAGKHTEHHERQMLLTKTNKDTTSNITYDSMA
jgi:hypothetical protein